MFVSNKAIPKGFEQCKVKRPGISKDILFTGAAALVLGGAFAVHKMVNPPDDDVAEKDQALQDLAEHLVNAIDERVKDITDELSVHDLVDEAVSDLVKREATRRIREQEAWKNAVLGRN